MKVMERARITCPETGHLEEVDLDRTPAGIVIADCSRLHRNCALECPRECARRMDRRDRLVIDDRTERVLIAYASDRQGKAKLAAEVLSDDLTHDQMAVQTADVETAPPPHDYDAVVIGSCVWLGRHARSVTRYVMRYRDALVGMPSFLFSIDDHVLTGHRAGARLTHKTGWYPSESAAFRVPPPIDPQHPLRRLVAWLRDREPPRLQEIGEFALRIAEHVPAAIPPSIL
jgi:hypothetical protein